VNSILNRFRTYFQDGTLKDRLIRRAKNAPKQWIEPVFNKHLIRERFRFIFQIVTLKADLFLKWRMFEPGSYHEEQGSIQSFKNRTIIDGNGNITPWFTYNLIDFIQQHDIKNLSIFEWGSGNSTRWWADRAKSVISIEHSEEWYQKTIQSLSSCKNVTLRHIPLELNDAYSTALSKDDPCDIIIVDGRKRVECARHAFETMPREAILILDDSQRNQYDKIFTLAQERGYKCLRFNGPKALTTHTKQAAIFYHKENALGI